VTGAAVVALSLGSALAAATSSVLQHRSARMVRHEPRHRLFGHLLTRPVWFAGLIAGGVGLVLHAAALVHGSLVVVQPLLISGVLFALPVSVVLEGNRPSGVEWLWALVLVGGLATFLLAADPSPAIVRLDADALAWCTLAGLAIMGVITLVATRFWHGHSAALLGTAAGIGYGVAAALLKQTMALLQVGVSQVLTDWPVYALIGVGVVSLGLTQLAYHSGPLASSMPAITVTDPATSIIIGTIAFHELLGRSAIEVTGQIFGFLVMVLATIELARRNQEIPHHRELVSAASPESARPSGLTNLADLEAELPRAR
jgi:drug/metabolite transporter (DMT)-like permease